MNKMNIPGFNAEASLYKPTKGYAVAPNRTSLRGGAIVPAQRPISVLSTDYVPTTPMPGVAFLIKKVCWDETSSTSKFAGLTFQTDCKLCQWFKQTMICDTPPVCHMGWIRVSDPNHECSSSLVGID